MDTCDTAWVLASAVLVMVMVPGFGFSYGGLVRQKNALATIMQSLFILALISVQWVLWGYSLAFGPDIGGIIGSLEWVGLNNVGLEPNADYAATIPHKGFMIFQAMFAIITPALITGAFPNGSASKPSSSSRSSGRRLSTIQSPTGYGQLVAGCAY